MMRHVFRVALGGAVTVSVLLLPGVAQAAPPPNDNFANRATIASLPFTTSVTTTEATTETGEPDPGEAPTFCGFDVGKTVWYQFTPTTNLVVDADTFGSNFDTVLAVWTGTSLNALSSKVCNDDTVGLDSEVVFQAFAGTTYLFQVGGYGGDSGALELHLKGLGTILPKSVLLTAPKSVKVGKKAKLTATVTPCAGHQGDNVEFYRGSKKIGTKASNDSCVAVLKTKVKKTAKYHAVSPVQDDDHLAGVSKTVRVRAKP